MEVLKGGWSFIPVLRSFGIIFDQHMNEAAGKSIVKFEFFGNNKAYQMSFTVYSYIFCFIWIWKVIHHRHGIHGRF